MQTDANFISFIEKTKGQLAANMSKKIPNKNDQTNADGYLTKKAIRIITNSHRYAHMQMTLYYWHQHLVQCVFC